MRKTLEKPEKNRGVLSVRKRGNPDQLHTWINHCLKQYESFAK